jgi:hypothetical protein
MGSTDRLSGVLRAMADVPHDGDRSLIDRVSLAAVGLLSLRAAGISLMADGELRGTAGVSDAGIAAIQELQLTLGEGPCVDAWRGGEPVLEPDVANAVVPRWPAFAGAAVQAGVRAVFAFPLHLGAVQLGVLVLYREQPGSLDPDELATAILLAEVATQIVLALQAGAPADRLHHLLASEPPHWAEIHQATGMLASQLDVSLDEAFVRLRAYAFACERPLRDIAREVVGRRLDLRNTEPEAGP